MGSVAGFMSSFFEIFLGALAGTFVPLLSFFLVQKRNHDKDLQKDSIDKATVNMTVHNLIKSTEDQEERLRKVESLVSDSEAHTKVLSEKVERLGTDISGMQKSFEKVTTRLDRIYSMLSAART